MISSALVSVIIVAAGKGERMKGSTGLAKQFLPIGGVPILAHTLNVFNLSEVVDEIVLVTRPEFRAQCGALIERYHIQKATEVVSGGKERRDSVWNGLQAADFRTEIVLIHDAVRMFVSQAMISESVQEARRHGAGVVAVPAKDTIKQVTLHREEDQEQPSDSLRGLFVEKTFDRSVLWQIQTPQTFQFDLICHLHQQAAELDLPVTDDAMLAEHFGHSVKIVPGSYRNIKITTSDDLLIAEAFWQDERRKAGVMESWSREHIPTLHCSTTPALHSLMLRVGIGYDVHRLVGERELILGGVTIPFEKGLLGHSDADVLIHAICDAILGALRLGDIGKHFPDNDPTYKGISSMILLGKVKELMEEQKYRLGNLDAVVIAQRPKLRPYIEEMQQRLAEALKTQPERVNVKATTTEGLGFTGTGEGIAAQAVVQLVHTDFSQSERF